MNKPINLLVGGLTLFAAQGCKAPKQASQQAEHPNIIYLLASVSHILPEAHHIPAAS